MKDNFSTQSKQYAQFRPAYPKAFYDFILGELKTTDTAWDCATGNGQVAVELAKTFNHVYATDISENQLANAPQKENITYLVEQAEDSSFKDQSFDLITVAQAIHWFNFDAFFATVKRTLKPDGLFVAVGYDLMKIDEKLDPVIHYLYQDILGSYWDEERKHIERRYQSIPFPLKEIDCPSLEIQTTWNFEQLIGYLATWSALQHYIKARGNNPIDLVIDKLRKAWGGEENKTIHFPLIMKAGRNF